MTPKQQLALKLWKEGLPYREIERRAGISEGYLSKIIRIDPEFARFKRKKNPFDYAEQISLMRAQGANIRQIAKMLHLSIPAVSHVVNSNGYHRPRKTPRPVKPSAPPLSEEKKQLIIDLASQAKSWNEILLAADCTLYMARRVLRQNGLWPKPTIPRVMDEDQPWFPEDGAPTYNDNFVLKPEHRTRLEYVQFRRMNGDPIISFEGCDYGRKKNN